MRTLPKLIFMSRWLQLPLYLGLIAAQGALLRAQLGEFEVAITGGIWVAAGGKVETRIANAAHDATYLLAEVEVVASYKLADINRTKLENLFHRIFAPAQLDLTIQDRFGHPVRPREWFLVPLHVIDEAVKRIRDGSIAGMAYEPKTARLVSRNEQHS